MKSLSRLEYAYMQLQLAGIPNLDHEEVARYMQYEAAKYKPNWVWHVDEYLDGNFEQVAFGIVLMVLALCFTVVPASIVDTMILPIAAVACLAALVVFLSVIKKVAPPAWNRYRLDPGYRSYLSTTLKRTEPVPSFVTERAVRIKELIPEAAFEVAALEQDRMALDPVLYLIVDNTAIAVDVWKGEDRVLLS